MITSKNATRTRLNLEALEDRLAMTVSVVNGALTITGNNYSNTVIIDYQGGGSWWDPGYYRVYDNGTYTNISPWSLWSGTVYFHGNAGTDVFINNTSLATIAKGHGGFDYLSGGSNDDWLDGGAGYDVLYGNGGNDTLMAGFEYDYSSGGEMYGGEGHDSLYGGLGPDRMYGEGGNDFLAGSNGDDWLYGGIGNDHLYGLDGWDHLYGEDDNDILDGGQDAYPDILEGGSGADMFRYDWYFNGWLWRNGDQPRDLEPWDWFDG